MKRQRRGRRGLRRASRTAAVAALASLSLALPAVASANTITVNTTNDEFAAGPRCSLREAIWAANNDSNAEAPGCRAGAGIDLVRVPSGRFDLHRAAPFPTPSSEDAGLYGDLDVTQPVSIVHSGLKPSIIDSDVSRERVFHNLAGGSGLLLQGLAIQGATPRGSLGGGVLNQGVLRIVNSAISDNAAAGGGGLASIAGSVALLNTTIYGNSVREDGGGILLTRGVLSMRSTTVSGNRTSRGDGAGVFIDPVGPVAQVLLRDVLLAGNIDSGAEAHDCAKLGGTITSNGHNLIGNTNGCGYRRGPGDITNRSAQVVDFGDFGGPTPTVTLKKSSPAINHATRCPASDQRGVPRNLGGRCDIGAWELVRCAGVVVNSVGTDGAELLLGTSGPDGVLALGGADTVRGLGGNDGLCGGGGPDRLEAGGGNDHMDGGKGRDTCLGGGGQNRAVNCEIPARRPSN